MKESEEEPSILIDAMPTICLLPLKKPIIVNNSHQALRAYVNGHETNMYSEVTNAIYKAVFRENAKEYREILKLDSKDNVRHTLYAEVLLVIASFENGVEPAIRDAYNEKGNIKLTVQEVETLIMKLAEAPMQKPYLDDARAKMASRDLSFRDAYHSNIEEYLRACFS